MVVVGEMHPGPRPDPFAVELALLGRAVVQSTPPDSTAIFLERDQT